MDGSGNVYVGGGNSQNAFKITPGGVITAIIDSTGDGGGNPLRGPLGLAVDNAGNVYVAGSVSDNAFKIQFCPNGLLDAGEGCDDGNATGGDGCDTTCQVESGFTCSGEPSVCEPIVTPVVIDIKPGSDPNSINLGSHGVIPVAILTTNDFDATTVDPDTVELAGSTVAIRGNGNRMLASFEDVDGDGDVDLVLHIETENLSLETGATEATLTAETFDGEAIIGSDTIVIVNE